MTISYKTLLIISCISFSLHSMEDQSLTAGNSTQSTLPKKLYFYQITNIYRQAYRTLDTFDPTDTQSITNLSNVIEQTNKLKRKKNNNEHDIGTFAFKQEESFFNKLFASEEAPYNNPHYVSVLFARIAEYNTDRENKNFKTPTPGEFIIYKNNKKINTTVETASTIGLSLDIQKTNTKKNLKQDPSNNIDLSKFEQLIDDVNTMLYITPEDIKNISKILYGGEK